MTYGTTVVLHQPFDDAVAAVRVALSDQGFGVLTETDMQATMKAKVGADLAPYLILGACNPPLAYRALQAEPSVGLLLPCNVIIRQTDQGTVVEAIDPMTMVSISGNPALQPVVDEVAVRLNAALAALTAQTT
ncbi:MAG TPA: DUF302 domain-containing protein [Acidothermaceae bacterium]